ncbi:MAG: cupredoxin domain-containing protein [Chloroflexota bacterium]
MEIVKRSSNKSMRIIILGMLAMLALVSLSACGGTTDAQPTATTAVQEALPTATTATQAAEPTATMEMGNAVDALPEATAPADSQPTTAPATGGDVTEVQATLKEWSIALSQAEVPAGKVRFTVTNAGQMAHNLTVTDSSGTLAKTPNFNASQGTQTLEIDLKPGTYTLICSLPGHAQRGQKIDLVVK